MLKIHKNKTAIAVSALFSFIFLSLFIKDSVYAQSIQTTFTEAQVAQHATEADCWIIVSGKVYAVTSYIAMHPGGRSRIINQCGSDATAPFETRGGTGSHSSGAHSTLGTFLIGTVATSGIPAPLPINGSCGTSNGQTVTTKPTSNLCASGTASSASGGGPWTWTCSGANGGTTAQCSASVVVTPVPASVNGSCGTSSGQALAQKPTTNLCQLGTATSVSGNGPWTWKCEGSNNGTSAVCGASLFIPTPTPTPNPTSTQPVAMCSYPVPPAGCTYIHGPEFVASTGCGLVLSCAIEATSTVGVPTSSSTAVLLIKGQMITIPSMLKGTEIKYTFVIPENARNLTIKTTGGTGDADIFLNRVKTESRKKSVWKSDKTHSNEQIKIENPRTGTYYLSLYAYSNTTATTLVFDYMIRPNSTRATSTRESEIEREQQRNREIDRSATTTRATSTIATSTRQSEIERETERNRGTSR